MVDHDHSSAAEYGVEAPRKRVKLERRSLDVAMPDTDDNVLPTNVTIENASITPPDPLVEAANLKPLASNNMAATLLAQDEAIDIQISKEASCGITEFVCPNLLGFTGTLKKRYTDFLVNEILPSGQVVHLDDTRAPRKKKEQEPKEVSEPSAHEDLEPKADGDKYKKAEANLSTYSKDTSPSAPLPDTAETAARVEPDVPENTTIPSPRIAGAEGASSQHHDLQTAHNIPLSMQGFDLPAEKPKSLAPHMRAPVSSSMVPVSMREFEGTDATAKPARTKETVRVRQTSQGWIEVDEANAQSQKNAQVATTTLADTLPEDVAMQQEDKKEHRPNEEGKEEEPTVQSSQASWQAFADETSADTEASTGFQLRSEDLTALLSYFGPDVVNNILALHDRILKSPHRKAKDYGTVRSAVIDRHTRSKIHQDLRRIFESRLETTTDNDGAMVIAAMPEEPSFYGRTPINDSHGDNNRGNRDRGRGRGRGRGRNDRGRGNTRNDRSEGESRMYRHNKWAELGGDFLHFTLYKENKDTMESISWLAKQLQMRPSAFQFAGTKDRRGVTVQRVSVYRVLAERMVNAGHTLRNTKLGNFEYQPHALQLGELTGNEFVITLRDCDFHYPMPVDSKTMVDAAEAVVGEAIQNLAANGFINYYGLQRFGTFANSTDQTGLKMLQGNFEAAVDSILHFSSATLAAARDPMAYTDDKIAREDQARALAINSFKSTGKAYPALHDLPKKYSAEYSIIQHLSKPNTSRDFFGAMQQISRNLRLMYVHAYQSLVWNVAASERWKRFGSALVEGDLVLVDEHKDKIDSQPPTEESDADGEAIVRPAEDDRASKLEDMFTRARALSKEEAESGKYNIFDIVLPTPGFDIIYPANGIEKFYEDFMSSERGGGLNPHDMRRKWKDASLSGSYRKLLARPSKDFSFDVKVYKDEDEQFVETDLDRLRKAKEEKVHAHHTHSAPLRDDPAQTETIHNQPHTGADKSKPEPKQEILSPTDSEPGGVSLSGGPYRDYKIAVILKLQLGSSTYATMALRELMKHGGARTFKPDFGGGR